MRDPQTRRERMAHRIGHITGYFGSLALAIACGALWIWAIYATVTGVARWAVGNAESIALLIVAVGIVIAALRLAWNLGGRR